MLLDVNKKLRECSKTAESEFWSTGIEARLGEAQDIFWWCGQKTGDEIWSSWTRPRKELAYDSSQPKRWIGDRQASGWRTICPCKACRGSKFGFWKIKRKCVSLQRRQKKVWLWAYCANSNKASPYGQLEATDYVLDCDLSNQSSVWRQTQQFEHWDSVLMAHFKLADLVLSLGS